MKIEGGVSDDLLVSGTDVLNLSHKLESLREFLFNEKKKKSKKQACQTLLNLT